jgi:hypothetical protein
MQTLDSIKNNNRQNPDEIGKKITQVETLLQSKNNMQEQK